jgi:hypothetical protein
MCCAQQESASDATGDEASMESASTEPESASHTVETASPERSTRTKRKKSKSDQGAQQVRHLLVFFYVSIAIVSMIDLLKVSAYFKLPSS